MYTFFKKNIKSLIPKQFLFQNELFFRSFYGVFYLGNNHQCNICKKKLRTFVHLENDDLLCPFCGSLSRNRRLYRLFKKERNIDYYSSDFTNAFLADYKFDITNIEQENKKFNLIICYHILEHIIDDEKGMSELYRVLNDKGHVYIQTPFKEGDIYEDYTITSQKERIKHFGQFDHVRIYSVNGLKKRLENNTFNVSVNTFNNKIDDIYNGYKSPETILILSKK